MHESSLAMSLLDIVVDQASRFQADAVQRVDLCLGELAGVEATTLVACFAMLAEGSVAQGAELVIERIPVSGTCTVCGAAARKKGRLLCCPACGAASVKLATGRELYVKSIEVEKTSAK